MGNAGERVSRVLRQEFPGGPVAVKEETDRAGPILGQAVNLRLHAWPPSQWTLNFVAGVYRNGIPMGNQTPRIKEPQDLDSPLPKRIC